MKFMKQIYLFILVLLMNITMPVNAAEHKLTLAYLPVKGTLYVEVTEQFAERIKSATQGQVEIILNDSLVKGTQLAQSVRDGRVQLSTILAGYYSATNPEFGLAQLPGLMNNVDEFKSVFYGLWRADMNRIFAEKYNSRVLMWGLFAPQNLISIKPIKTAADFAGKKIRVHNIETATLVASLGAKPTPMPASEVLPSLQRGIIDGVFTSSAWAYGQAFYTVAKHVTLWPTSTILPFPIVINNDVWEKLSKENQDAIMAASRQLEEESFANYVDKMNSLPEKWAAKGATYYVAPESEIKLLFDKKHLKPVYESFFTRSEKVGFNGRNYVNQALKILDKNLEY